MDNKFLRGGDGEYSADGLHPDHGRVGIDVVEPRSLSISFCDQTSLVFDGVPGIVVLFGEHEFIRYRNGVGRFVDEVPSAHAAELFKLRLNCSFPFGPFR